MRDMIEFLNGLYVRLTTHEEKDEGQGLVEYALILALVAIVVIAALIILGPAIGNVFNKVSTNLNSLPVTP